MAVIAFIGLGNMGAPMAANLVKAGHVVRGVDVVQAAVESAANRGVEPRSDAASAATGADAVITMLPAGQHVEDAYQKKGGILDSTPSDALLIDCSTIDVETARAVHSKAGAKGFAMIDAPVSGGVTGAENAALTFMVGGEEAAFTRAEPILQAMGKAIVHAGAAGNGQAAKICNNLLLGIHMISVGEAFVLAEKLGLDAQKLFDISSKASGQCWSLTTYCPVPGPVPTSPANRDYQPGFTAAMMLKDLRLAMGAADASGANLELGAKATALYDAFVEAGHAGLDFSGIIRSIRD